MTKKYKLSVELYHKEALRVSTIIVEGFSQMQNTSWVFILSEFFFQLAKRKERREEAQKGLAQAEEAGELTYPAGNSVKHLLGSMIRSQDRGQWNGHQWILVISSWKFK